MVPLNLFLFNYGKIVILVFQLSCTESNLQFYAAKTKKGNLVNIYLYKFDQKCGRYCRFPDSKSDNVSIASQGTLVNLTFPSLHEGSFESML